MGLSFAPHPSLIDSTDYLCEHDKFDPICAALLSLATRRDPAIASSALKAIIALFKTESLIETMRFVSHSIRWTPRPPCGIEPTRICVRRGSVCCVAEKV